MRKRAGTATKTMTKIARESAAIAFKMSKSKAIEFLINEPSLKGKNPTILTQLARSLAVVEFLAQGCQMVTKSTIPPSFSEQWTSRTSYPY